MSAGLHAARETSRLLGAQPVGGNGPALFGATVTAVSWPHAKIRPTGATTAGEQLIALPLGLRPVAGDRVICAYVDGEPVVLWIAAPTDDGPRQFAEPLVETTAALLASYAASTTVTNATDDYTPYINEVLQLPPGLWTVTVDAAITMRNSDGGNMTALAGVSATTSGNYILPGISDEYATVFAHHESAGRSGAITVFTSFRRSGGAGTVTAEAGRLLVHGRRTA